MCHGRAGPGLAGLGAARPGKAWHGKGSNGATATTTGDEMTLIDGKPVKGKIPSVYMQRLWPVIEGLQRGDTLTDERILEVVPELRGHKYGAKYMDGLIRSWLRRERAIEVSRRYNSGYYLLTDIEQAQLPKKGVEGARKKIGRGMAAGQGVDPRNIPDDERGKLEHTMRLAATLYQIATETAQRIRLELGESNLEEKRLGSGAR